MALGAAMGEAMGLIIDHQTTNPTDHIMTMGKTL